MRVLIDTCVWSLALRRSPPIASLVINELKELILRNQIEIIGPIRQELLSGIRSQEQFSRLKKYLSMIPDLILVSSDYVLAASFFNECRNRGVQGSNTDFLLCAVAVRRNLSIFTTDKDFAQFAKYLPITLHWSITS